MERTESLTAVTAPARELPGSYVDWPAILGGAVVAAAIVGLCTTFGAALGLATISAEPGEGSFNAWAIISSLWVVVSIVAAFLVGGYLAGRMTRRVDAASADEVATRDGVNGLIVWGLGMLVSAWFAASAVGTAATAVGTAAGGVAQGAGALAGGVSQAAGTAASGLVQGAGAAIGGVSENEDATSFLNDTLMRPVLGGAADPAPTDPSAEPGADDAELARQTGAILANVVRTGEISDEERSFLISAAAQRTGLPENEVEARVDAAVTRAVELRDEAAAAVEEAEAEAARLAQEAEEAAIAAAETARKAGILTAFLLTAASVVAGAAAVAGGVRGGRHRDEGKFYGGLSYRL